MTARKTVKTTAPAEVAWFVTGRGKSASYYAAIPADVRPAEGVAVALVAKTGAITYGTLNAPAADLDDKATARLAELPAGTAVWTFKRDNAAMTAEIRANNAALKSEARAAFLRSPAGIAQAERIAERAAKREAEQAAGIPDTRTVTTRQATAEELAPAAEAPAADHAPTLAEQAEALKAAGFTAAQILAALSSVNPPAAPAAPSKPAAGRKPAAGKPVSLSALNAAAGRRTAK